MATCLRIGICVGDRAQQHVLQGLISDCGHQIDQVVLHANLENLSTDTDVDAWVVLVHDEPDLSFSGSSFEEVLNDWLDQLQVPAVICESDVFQAGSDDSAAWTRRLKEKLSHLEGTINLEAQTVKPARQVWVLAASTGGPAAVKDFLAELPPGLGIGFVYVQHINRGFDDTLIKAISKHNHYPASLVVNGQVVEANKVSIVPTDCATEVLVNGTFSVSERAWQAPYSPSVDCVVTNVAWAYPQRCGVIVFTGMGDDGAAGCRMMHQKGGQVWVQTPGSCTIDSMPKAVIDQGCVSFKGTPYALAQHLVQTVQKYQLAAGNRKIFASR